ncbi:MAG: hypothetical protein GX222_04350 [Ruminococcaceae bacterium]|nr:hypothetical protein [Oscillospiraceae bacterium]
MNSNNGENKEQVICKNCGAVPGEEAMFCTVCGSFIDRTPEYAKAEIETPVPASDLTHQTTDQYFSQQQEYAYQYQPETFGNIDYQSDIGTAQPTETYASDAGYQNYSETAQTAETYESGAGYQNYNQTMQPAEAYGYDAGNQNYAYPAEEPIQYQLNTQQPVKKKSKKKLIIILSSVLLVAIAAAIIIPLSIKASKQAKYDDAILLMESGSYAEAQTIFAGLGDFEDSADKALFCKNSATYEDAIADLENEDYENARAKFFGLGSFKDSPGKVQYCDYFISYGEAEGLFNSGDYEAARDIYNLLPADLFPDAMEKYDLCLNKKAYIDAEGLYNEGKFYDAYLAFEELGDFEDASERQLQCVQPFPGTAATYQNEEYSSTDLSLKISPYNDGNRNYLKIYTDTDVLVCCVAIEVGDTARISLPAGNYKIKRAFGTGEWFGETDMFGDEGTYFLMINSNEDTEYFYLEYGGDYILTIGAPGYVPGNPVGEENEDRNTF